MKLLNVFAWLYPSYFQMNVAAAVVGSAVVGGVMNSNAAGKASDAQSGAAAQADATQRYQYDQTRADNAPFRNQGVSAVNQLGYLYGLNPKSGATNYATSGGVTYDPSAPFANPAANAEVDRLAAFNGRDAAIQQVMAGWGATLNPVDPNLSQNALADASSDPQFGSLLRNFSQADLDADPIYQNTFKFALDEGTKGLDRIAAASGNMLSGAAAKALTRFGANTAATFGNDSFNRKNVQDTNTVNRLSGLAGTGQQATNQVTSAGTNMANNISSNQTALGTARGASAIAQGNAWGNSLSNGVNAFQQNQLMNKIFPTAYGVAQQPGVTGWVSQG